MKGHLLTFSSTTCFYLQCPFFPLNPLLPPSPLCFSSAHFPLLRLLLLLFPHHSSPLFLSSYLPTPLHLLGDPLQLPGHSGGAGEADIQRSGWRFGGLVWFPSCLPLLPHPLGRDSPARVDGYLHRCSQGAPAQRTAQVRLGSG